MEKNNEILACNRRYAERIDFISNHPTMSQDTKVLKMQDAGEIMRDEMNWITRCFVGSQIPVSAIDKPTSVGYDVSMNNCPTCDSPDHKRHPAVQFEGEVQICSDAFHTTRILE